MTTASNSLQARQLPWPLWGRALRLFLTAELMEHGTRTVAELVVAVETAGHVLHGRASKTISDALRWEVRNERVARIGRGRYRYLGAPATTAKRIRIFAARATAWITAVTTTGETPPPTPPDPRSDPPPGWQRPYDPPWAHLSWLWAL